MSNDDKLDIIAWFVMLSVTFQLSHSPNVWHQIGAYIVGSVLSVWVLTDLLKSWLRWRISRLEQELDEILGNPKQIR